MTTPIAQGNSVLYVINEDEDKGHGTWHRPLRGDEDLPPETA